VKGGILVIDTNEALAEIWAKRFEMDSFDVAVLIDGKTMVKDIVKHGVPDVIVSGLEPGNNAPTTTKEICSEIYGKLSGKTPPALIQLHSVHLSEKARRKLEKSAFQLMMKPVSPAKLLEAVRRAFLQHLKESLSEKRQATMTVDLRGGALMGLLQFVDMGKRSGLTIVSSPNSEAYFEFQNGAPVDARAKNLLGEDAFLEVLAWNTGEASFFESDIKEDSPLPISNIQSLLEKHTRQTEMAAKAEEAFDDPDVLIVKNKHAQTTDENSDAEIVANAIGEQATLSELKKQLPEFTLRRLLAALGEMLAKNEIRRERRVVMEDTPSIKPQLVAEVLAEFHGENALTLIRHPASIGVYCVDPKTTRKFIGTLCGRKMASHAVFEAGKYRVVIGEIQKRGGAPDFFDTDACIIIMDLNKKANSDDALETARTAKTKFIVAVPEKDGEPTTSEKLDLGAEPPPQKNFQWNEKSVLSVLEELFVSLA